MGAWGNQVGTDKALSVNLKRYQVGLDAHKTKRTKDGMRDLANLVKFGWHMCGWYYGRGPHATSTRHKTTWVYQV